MSQDTKEAGREGRGCDSTNLLGVRVDATSYDHAAGVIARWAHHGESRTVIAANVHVTMEAYDSEAYRRAVGDADLVTPDGMPLAWVLRLRGKDVKGRVYGPDLMLEVLDRAAREGLPVGFYGGQSEVLERLRVEVVRRFPSLKVVYAESPPFRPLSDEEDRQAVDDMVRSGLRILFVGLGCPKQEFWVAAHRGRVPAVLMAVGAAFAFVAGSTPQAPRWMMNSGLEWLFRLLTEPRRLWRRYLLNNPRFVLLVLREQLARPRPSPAD
jgi:N-acetylglucosaminyldiphosphoundecaprenol N-acetyl-beta-D-mannosaminyltransferase